VRGKLYVGGDGRKGKSLGVLALGASELAGTWVPEVLGIAIEVYAVLRLAGAPVTNYVGVKPNALQYVGADVLELVPGLGAWKRCG